MKNVSLMYMPMKCVRKLWVRSFYLLSICQLSISLRFIDRVVHYRKGPNYQIGLCGPCTAAKSSIQFSSGPVLIKIIMVTR